MTTASFRKVTYLADLVEGTKEINLPAEDLTREDVPMVYLANLITGVQFPSVANSTMELIFADCVINMQKLPLNRSKKVEE